MSHSSVSLPAHIARSREVPALNVFGIAVTPLAGAPETADACSVARVVCPPGADAPFHRHAQAENFYVVRGRLAVRLGADTVEVAAGDFVHIPPHLPHTFANPDTAEAEFITFGTPAGHDRFFCEADALARSGGFNPQSATALCTRHGIELLR
ncbi:MAG: cupin domain-containing protein [Opitutaceae bacterium]